MRVFEVVAAVSTGRTPVDATGGAVDATGGGGDSLRLPEGAQGSVGSTPPGGVVLVAPGDVDAASLGALLSEVPDGADVVVFLPTTPLTLPVGVVVDAFSASGVQAVDAVPVEHARFGVAVIGTRTDAFAPVGSYLSGRAPIVADDAALKRIVAERGVEGLAARASLADAQKSAAEVETLKAELAASRSDLAATRKRLDDILTSPSYSLARRIAKVKPSKGTH